MEDVWSAIFTYLSDIVPGNSHIQVHSDLLCMYKNQYHWCLHYMYHGHHTLLQQKQGILGLQKTMGKNYIVVVFTRNWHRNEWKVVKRGDNWERSACEKKYWRVMFHLEKTCIGVKMVVPHWDLLKCWPQLETMNHIVLYRVCKTFLNKSTSTITVAL